MTIFQATHKLIAPAGEEIPVMLVSQPDNMRYLVMTEIDYEEQTQPFYQWLPGQGVTYNGWKLEGLEILPLTSAHKSHSQFNIYEAKNKHFANRMMVL